MNDLLENLLALRLSVQHILVKLPSPLLSMVDFASRNPVECSNPACRVCQEHAQSEIMFFGAAQVSPNLYLSSTTVWRDVQQSCPDLRRVLALLQAGKTLTKKEKNLKDVRAYLRLCTKNKADLLVCLKPIPFQLRPVELIVIPRSSVTHQAGSPAPAPIQAPLLLPVPHPGQEEHPSIRVQYMRRPLPSVKDPPRGDPHVRHGKES